MNEHPDQERALLREAARRLAASRRVVGTIQCAECGQPVVATTAGAPTRKRKYCSPACKQRAYDRQHAAEIRARRRARYAAQRQVQPSREPGPLSPENAASLPAGS